MQEFTMQDAARTHVVQYVNERAEATNGLRIVFEDTFVVWFCKTLQNWKALVGVHVLEGVYYELTHNGDKDETYLDAYRKFDNVAIPAF